LFRIHKEQEIKLDRKRKNLDESFNEQLNKSKMSQSSKELMESKGPREDVFASL